MKYANKIGAAYSMILGADEIEKGKAVLKCMETGEGQEIELSNIANIVKEIIK